MGEKNRRVGEARQGTRGERLRLSARATERKGKHADMWGGRAAAAMATPTTISRANVRDMAFRANVGGTELRQGTLNTADVGARMETTSRVKLRFKRMGRKKRPFYRLVAIDSRRKREGLALEELGYYNPLTKETHLNAESIQKWIKDGAEPSDTVASLLKKAMPSVVQK